MTSKKQHVEEKFIGIDNGLSGAIVVIQGKQIVDSMVMPTMPGGNGKSEYDVLAIFDFLTRHNTATVILEKAQYTPAMGGVSAFSFAKNYGIMIGLLTALKMRYHIVHAKTWQAIVFRDQPHADTKQASAIVAQRLFPEQNFKVGVRTLKIHDGLTDATCLAYYGSTFIYTKSPIKM